MWVDLNFKLRRPKNIVQYSDERMWIDCNNFYFSHVHKPYVFKLSNRYKKSTNVRLSAIYIITNSKIVSAWKLLELFQKNVLQINIWKSYLTKEIFDSTKTKNCWRMETRSVLQTFFHNLFCWLQIFFHPKNGWWIKEDLVFFHQKKQTSFCNSEPNNRLEGQRVYKKEEERGR